MRGCWRPNINFIFWPHPTVMTVTLCLSCSLRCSTRGLGVHSIGAFPRAPSVGCGLPYHIWSLLSGRLLATASGGSECPSVGCGLPYHIWSLGVWNSTGNCIRGFPYHIWSLLSGRLLATASGGSECPSVGCGLPYHIWSLLSGNLLATPLGPKLNWVK